MVIYRLYTNERPSGILQRRQPTIADMGAYIRAKQAAGYRLADVVYCWGRVTVA